MSQHNSFGYNAWVPVGGLLSSSWLVDISEGCWLVATHHLEFTVLTSSRNDHISTWSRKAHTHGELEAHMNNEVIFPQAPKLKTAGVGWFISCNNCSLLSILIFQGYAFAVCRITWIWASRTVQVTIWRWGPSFVENVSFAMFWVASVCFFIGIKVFMALKPFLKRGETSSLLCDLFPEHLPSLII